MTRLSIIIPIHNAVADLPRCVDSLLAQVGADDEILLIEDSSTDGSDALCEQYAAKHPCIQTYHVNYRGPSPTRNHGIQRASGQYIMFVDADDWMEDQAIETMLARAKEHEMVVAGYFLETESSVSTKRISHTPTLEKKDVFALYRMEMLNVLWNKVFHGDIIRRENILFDPSLKKGEDLLFILQYLRHVSTTIGIVDQCFYHYISKETGVNRSHRESMDNKRSRMTQIMEQFTAIGADRALYAHHMLNMYFRHLRDYLSAEQVGGLRKLILIKKEARHSIVADILHDNHTSIRLLKLLHTLGLDMVMFLLNWLYLR